MLALVKYSRTRLHTEYSTAFGTIRPVRQADRVFRAALFSRFLIQEFDRHLTRKELAAQIRISPRYIASIENSGQTPSLQVFYRFVTCLDMSVDQFFFPEKVIAKTTQRRQLDTLLDNISENGLRIITAVAKEIADTEQKNSLK